MTWEEQERGRWLGCLTDRAVEFAGADDDTLATVGFAAFLSERGHPVIWRTDDPQVVEVRSERIGVRADRGDNPDTFTAPCSGEAWTLTTRVLRGATPILLLVGLSSTQQQQIDHFGPALPARAFLTVSDWLRQFPTEWKGATP